MQQKISTANISQHEEPAYYRKEAMVQNRNTTHRTKCLKVVPRHERALLVPQSGTPGSGPIPTNNRETHWWLLDIQESVLLKHASKNL
jgi:hypothetical protein